MSAAETAPPDAFEQLRKELDTAKGPQASTKQTTTGLSGAVMPDWQGAGLPSTRATPPTVKNPARDPKSANWLIEAMNRTAPDANRAQPDPERETREAIASGKLTTEDSALRTESEKAAAETETRDAKKRLGPDAAPDPFAQFLGGWMTPQDYALLRPAFSGESAASGTNREPGIPTAGASARAPDLAAVLRASAGDEAWKKNAAISAPQENPYLPALGGAGIPSVAAAAKTQPMPLPPRLPPVVTPLSPATVLSPIKAPASQPTSDDEKYFKQLKRF